MRKRSLLAIVTLIAMCVLGLMADALAQQTPPREGPDTPNVAQQVTNGVVTQGTLTSFFSARTPYEFWLTVLVAATGLGIIWIIVSALGKLQNVRPDDIAKPIIVIAVIMSTLILVTAGFSNQQIAPAFGLLGTIVGYILGRISTKAPEGPPEAQQDGNAEKKK